MDSTLFLAQIWGPVIMAMGLGMYMSRAYYVKVYQDIDKNVFAALIFGMVAMAVGIAQVLYHNVWGSFPEILISILGWGTLVKGALFILMPNFVDKMGDRWISMKLHPISGAITLIFGAYLTWFAYLA